MILEGVWYISGCFPLRFVVMCQNISILCPVPMATDLRGGRGKRSNQYWHEHCNALVGRDSHVIFGMGFGEGEQA